MTDPGDKVTKRYRELAREEPSASLDAAILAASRRAVARLSAARRWGPPVSIAAVLMLAVGVSLNMRHEQPGVEYAEPARPSPAPAAKPPAESAPLAQDRAPSLERRDAAAAPRPQPAAPSARKREEKFSVQGVKSKNVAPSAEVASEEKPMAKKDTALGDSAAERPVPRPLFVPEPASPAPAASPASPPAPVRATSGATAATAGRMKGEADALEQGVRMQALQPGPDQELERIARLRAEGRHAEADKALEEFRRRHPDFRIPAAMLERVRPPSSLPSPPPSPKGEGEQPR